LSLAVVQRHFVAVWIAANVLSLLLTLALYATGKERPHGSVVRDLWFGVELNPRWFGVDIKMFSYKPSLMGLMVLNASFAYAQYETHDQIGQAMMLYQIFTFIYVLNYFQFEYGMLYTWDIISERFGFMLVWGDYAFVPFCYSVTGWYLVDRLEPLPLPFLIGLPLLFAFGLWVFRGANSQKDRFKRDAQTRIWGKPAETIGGRILVSGFWGIGRKLNYSGEICVYIAWTALTGFSSIVPWLLPLWLISLLSHRAWRDDRRCREKYGALWEQYCRRARFRMLPFVY
jgi:delta14-sterol reductase